MKHLGTTGSKNQTSAGASRRWERLKRELEELNKRIVYAEKHNRIEEAIEMIDALMTEEALLRMQGMGFFE